MESGKTKKRRTETAWEAGESTRRRSYLASAQNPIATINRIWCKTYGNHQGGLGSQGTDRRWGEVLER
jgi:hypothetical protein